MTVGIAVFKEDYDNNWSSVALQASQLVNRILALKAELDAMTVAALQAVPSRTGNSANQYSSADGNLLKSAATDLANWALVFQGKCYIAAGATAGAGVVTPNDGTHFGYNFLAFVGQIYGFGV